MILRSFVEFINLFYLMIKNKIKKSPFNYYIFIYIILFDIGNNFVWYNIRILHYTYSVFVRKYC